MRAAIQKIHDELEVMAATKAVPTSAQIVQWRDDMRRALRGEG